MSIHGLFVRPLHGPGLVSGLQPPVANAVRGGSSVFASFGAVIAASSQSGKDMLINADGGNSGMLKNVTIATLVAADVTFH